MKRPLLLLGFSAFAACVLAAVVGPGLRGPLAAFCAGAGICGLLMSLYMRIGGGFASSKKNRPLDGRRPGAFAMPRKWAALGLAGLTAAGCLFRYGMAEGEMLPAQALAGNRVSIRGTVLDYPDTTGTSARYLVRVEGVRSQGRELEVSPFTLRLSLWQALSCQPGDRLSCEVKLYVFDSSGGLYSTRSSNWADGVAAGGYGTGGAAVLPGRRSLRAWFAKLRHRIGRNMEKLLPGDEAGFLRALLLGERHLVPDSVDGDFRRIGVTHLLALSGLHLTTLTALVSLAFRRVRRGVRSLLTALSVLFFLCLTGFPVSAVRSGIMLVLFLLGGALGERPDGLSSLGAAVLVICLVNPFSGGDLSFALSVFATLGILLFAGRLGALFLKPFQNRPGLKRLLRPGALTLGATLAAVLGTFPIQLCVFGGMSLVAPLANLLLAIPCTLALDASFLGAVLGLLPLPGLDGPWVLFAGLCSRLMTTVADALARFPLAYLDLREPRALLCLGLTVLVVAAVWVLCRRKRAVCAVLTVAVCPALLFGAVNFQDKGKAVLASAAGSSCVVLVKDGSAAVLSLGGWRTGAAEELLARCRAHRVEAVCLPVRDRDARTAAAGLLENWGAPQLILPEGAYLGRDLVLAAEGKVRYVGEGERFSPLDGVEVTASHGMERLTLSLYGVTVTVETGATGPGESGVLFTTQDRTEINSSFTVLQSDGIIDLNGLGPDRSALQGLPPGQAALAGENGLLLGLFPDGSMEIRGETLCLS